MDSIGFYVWLFPILFMIHEFEEIFLAEAWYARSKEKIHALWPKRIPFGLNRVDQFASASIGFGIFVEFIEFVLICLLCVIFNNYLAWFGLYITFIFHFFIPHLKDVIKFKGYEPGIISAAVVLIPSIWVIIAANNLLQYPWWTILLVAVVMYFVSGLILFRNLYGAMVRFSQFLVRFSKAGSA